MAQFFFRTSSIGSGCGKQVKRDETAEEARKNEELITAVKKAKEILVGPVAANSGSGEIRT
jgi:hypothetical protein